MAGQQVQPPGDRRQGMGPQALTQLRQAGRAAQPPAQRTQTQTQPPPDRAPGSHPGEILPGWVILPLRVFLGVSFLAAGWDKLTDPTYLDPSSRGYIGQQITQMAQGSPIADFLLNVAAPHATLFGVLVMGGELCIGLAVLLGLLTRFSAVMGALLNLTFFLSATWEVHPFYFGADLPYLAGWLTLLLAGPGPFALDYVLHRWLTEVPAPVVTSSGRVIQPPVEPGREMTRRAFVGGGAAVVAGVALAATGLSWAIAHPASSRASVVPTPQPQANPPTSTSAAPTATTAPAPTQAAGGGTAPTQAPQPTQPPAQPTPTTAPAAPQGQLIAQAGSVPAGQAMQFTLPTGDPAVLVHNDSGYSAYVAICTHQGCTVQPIGQGYLGCPCHGAIFDTNSQGDPVRGPARRPLSPVDIQVDPKGNVYLAS